MRVLWLCNIYLPAIAAELNLKASNKEGWLSGICDAVKKSHDFELGICFPVPKELDGFFREIDGISYYGFYEDTSHPETYDRSLEDRLKRVKEHFRPDVVHIFGTEFPHTLAMCKLYEHNSDRVLVGIQGIVSINKDHYFDGLPDYVVNRVTFRDFLRKDSLRTQLHKYELRALNEIEAVSLAGNITGRTPFDLEFTTRVNPEAKYHFMNETLRSEFYDGHWTKEQCEPHSVFVSQGNYPIKGLHVLFEAMPEIRAHFPDVHVYVAGDEITRYTTLKEKIKISSYGKYLRELIKKYRLQDVVSFVGSIDAATFRERLLKCNVFVSPSSIENSPNSVGEAMLLGVPTVASNVGGVPGIFKGGVDGLMFENQDSKGLAEAVCTIFTDDKLVNELTGKASMHAHITHNPDTNYKRLYDIYCDIAGER